MAEKKTKTNQYEGMFLFGSGAPTEPQAPENTVRKFIEQHGGNPPFHKNWDGRKRAYEINNNNGDVCILSLSPSQSAAIAQTERDVKLSEAAIRVMLLKAAHIDAEEIQNHEPDKPEP